jgi:transposase-like protein
MSISEHKHMPEPVRRIEVFTGAGRRRSWSVAEKAAIIAESYGAGDTVCAVARRHGLTPQQLFAAGAAVRHGAATDVCAGDCGADGTRTADSSALAPPHASSPIAV